MTTNAAPTNWAGNVTFGAETVARPTSLDELRAVIAGSSKLRVVGGGHSFGPIADTTGTLVSLADLPADVEIDGDRGKVKVAAGLSYTQVVQKVHDKGWALHNLASLPHISVVGGCATATHGSGDANGNLATAVSALEILNAHGDLVTLDRTSPDFNGAVVSLGALGVVVSVTLDLVPTFDVRQQVYEDLSLDALTAHFDEITSSAYSVSFFSISWDNPIEQVWLKQRAQEASPLPDSYGMTPAPGPRSPIPEQDPAVCTTQLGEPGPWFERLPHFRADVVPSSGSELQSEYLVPREHAVGAIRAVHELRDRIAPLLWCAEIRTIAADELWLSPSYQRNVVGLHFTWRYDMRAVSEVLPELEARLAPYEPTPHWGKLYAMPPAVVRSRYERLNDFVLLAERFDPRGKFRNSFLDHYLFADL